MANELEFIQGLLPYMIIFFGLIFIVWIIRNIGKTNRFLRSRGGSLKTAFSDRRTLFFMIGIVAVFWTLGFYLTLGAPIIGNPETDILGQITKAINDIFQGDFGQSVDLSSSAAGLILFLCPAFFLLMAVAFDSIVKSRQRDIKTMMPREDRGAIKWKEEKGNPIKQVFFFSFIFTIVYAISFALLWNLYAFTPDVKYEELEGGLIISSFHWAAGSGLAAYLILCFVIATLVAWFVARYDIPVGVSLVVLGTCTFLFGFILFIKLPMTINGKEVTQSLWNSFYTGENFWEKIIAIGIGIVIFFVSINYVLAFIMVVFVGASVNATRAWMPSGIEDAIDRGFGNLEVIVRRSNTAIGRPAKHRRRKKRNTKIKRKKRK